MLVRTATVWPDPQENIRQYVEDYVKNIYHGHFQMDLTLRRTCDRIGLTPSKRHLAKFVQLAVAEAEVTR